MLEDATNYLVGGRDDRPWRRLKGLSVLRECAGLGHDWPNRWRKPTTQGRLIMNTLVALLRHLIPALQAAQEELAKMEKDEKTVRGAENLAPRQDPIRGSSVSVASTRTGSSVSPKPRLSSASRCRRSTSWYANESSRSTRLGVARCSRTSDWRTGSKGSRWPP